MRVLLLCLGNICRSPSAHGVMRELASREGLALEIDSAGTGGWHVGSPPDARSRKAARQRGYVLDDLRARQLVADDFNRFDLILTMDAQNLHDARAVAPPDGTASLSRFLDYAGIGGDVPDPYYTGDFDAVLDLIERASIATLARLSRGEPG